MTIYIGADHRGFELKNQLVEWLKETKHDVEDCGNTVYDPEDDYPDFAKCVAKNVQKTISGEDARFEASLGFTRGVKRAEKRGIEPALGIVICGSGIGVSVAANRYKGIICGLGFDVDQIKHARENDHINMLSIPSDYVDFEKAKAMINTFIDTKPKMEEKYLRRAKKLDVL